MDNNFLEKIKTKEQSINDFKKWNQKIDSFFYSFDYLNSSDMIQSHINKITHIGINSLNGSSEAIRIITLANMELIENNIKKVTSDVSLLTQSFNILQESTNFKPSFFNKKSPSEFFISKFLEQQSNINTYSNNLKVKLTSLLESKKTIEQHIDTILYYFIILNRDSSFIKKIKNFVNDNNHLKKYFEEIEFETNQIQTDLLTQQQIIFQKYSALNIMLNNVINCIHNINYLTRTTSSCILNMVELSHIKNINNQQSDNFFYEIKNTISILSSNLNKINLNPFSKINI